MHVWFRYLGHHYLKYHYFWGITIFGILLSLNHNYFQQSKYVQNFIIKALPSQDNPTCNCIFFIDVVEFRMMLFNFLSQKRGGGKFSWLPRVCLVLLRRSQGRRLQPLNFSSSRLGFLRCVCLHISAHSQMHSTHTKYEQPASAIAKITLYCKY